MPVSEFTVVKVYQCERSGSKSFKFYPDTKCPCCEFMYFICLYLIQKFLGPIARSGHRIFSDANFIYAVGGYNPYVTELFINK